MEKFILKEILTPKFQLIVPNQMCANNSDIVKAINTFIENTTRQQGKFVSKDLEISNLDGWNVVINNHQEYSKITLEKVELTITAFNGID